MIIFRFPLLTILEQKTLFHDSLFSEASLIVIIYYCAHSPNTIQIKRIGRSDLYST